MPNGKHGDHPLTDILVHHRDVYSPLAASLVREIVALGDERTRQELSDLLIREYEEFSRPDVAKLERYLTELRNRLRPAAERGLE